MLGYTGADPGIYVSGGALDRRGVWGPPTGADPGIYVSGGALDRRGVWGPPRLMRIRNLRR